MAYGDESLAGREVICRLRAITNVSELLALVELVRDIRNMPIDVPKVLSESYLILTVCRKSVRHCLKLEITTHIHKFCNPVCSSCYNFDEERDHESVRRV